jgi:hypothetical protein
VEITEYKADGSIKVSIMNFKMIELLKFKLDILKVNSIDEQLVILKKKGLIPEQVSSEYLEKGMYERAEKLGISNKIIEEKSKIKLPILLTFFNRINAFCFGGMSLNIGLTPIMRLLHLFLKPIVPGADIIDIFGGIFSIVTSKGLIFDHTLITMPGISGFIGFVGFSFKFPIFMHMYIGYSAVTFGLGLGIHIKN